MNTKYSQRVDLKFVDSNNRTVQMTQTQFSQLTTNLQGTN